MGSGGQPLARATVEWLNRLGDAACERLIFDRLAEGVTTRQLVKELELKRELDDDGPVTRSGLYVWRAETDERLAAWQLAIKLGGEAHAEASGDILDEMKDRRFITKEEVKISELRSNHRKWLASVSDRERYGEVKQQGAGVVLNVEHLHLTAARSVGAALDDLYDKKRALPAPTEEVEEAEVIEITAPVEERPRRATLDDVLGPPPSLADVLE